jgi:hypothetical protein
MEIIGVCCESHTERVRTLYGQKAEMLRLSRVVYMRICSWQWDLNG